MGEYPDLDKALDLIHNDYMAGKIDIDKKIYPDQSALEDYKSTRLSNGDNPAINRAAVNKVNVDGGTPTGLIAPQLAKNPVFKSKSGVSLPYSVMGKIMPYADAAAQDISEMSYKGAEKLKEEREKIMAQTEAENAQKVAPNQNDNVQTDTMQPGEVQIDTMQKLKDNSFNQLDQQKQSMQKLKDDSLDQ